jgi:hypothetical protein
LSNGWLELLDAPNDRALAELLHKQRAAPPILTRSSAAHHHVVSSPTLDIRSATIPGNDALSRRQWNREVRCKKISKEDIWVFTLSPDSEHFSIRLFSLEFSFFVLG